MISTSLQEKIEAENYKISEKKGVTLVFADGGSSMTRLHRLIREHGYEQDGMHVELQKPGFFCAYGPIKEGFRAHAREQGSSLIAVHTPTVSSREHLYASGFLYFPKKDAL